MQFHVAPSGFYDNGLHEPVRRGLTIAVDAGRVESKGHIRLRSADPTWHPEIEAGYFDDGADLDAMIAGYRAAAGDRQPGPARQADRRAVGPGDGRPDDDDIVAAIGQLCQTLYHPVGDLRDGHGRGQRRRPRAARSTASRACGSPTPPSCRRVPRGNTNAPTIMVGEKAADLIKESR